ncbi:MAG TPA: 2,3-bisphosphoglycerate-dependent phosphoglycerate mutase [Rhabdochlamydiaceae bacterium]|nr:2,3-bisphosphoglycerate-dependent phosphoglycerate mutase [Rhabdochlamydiaceae bacterium]
MNPPTKLILLRHGQSLWNKLNFFTGWVDIPLSWEGIQEAIQAGKKISNIPIDQIFVSSLCRAQMTAMIVMAEHQGGRVPMVLHPGEGKLEKWAQIYNDHAEKMVVPVIEAWQLNERMYGELQGLNKQETAEKYGADQVKIWRRSYDVRPPGGESLEDTANRSIPYFKENIVPHLKAGRNVFVSAHGNSLRSIIMHLDGLTKEQVVHLELATGDPVIYDYVDGKWDKQKSHAHG